MLAGQAQRCTRGPPSQPTEPWNRRHNRATPPGWCERLPATRKQRSCPSPKPQRMSRSTPGRPARPRVSPRRQIGAMTQEPQPHRLVKGRSPSASPEPAATEDEDEDPH
eukprot:6306626-Pyramimonas_sp.AAC.1